MNTPAEILSSAQMAFVSERYEETINLCQKVIADNPTNTDAFVLAGNASLALNSFTKAEEYFQKAAELEPKIGEHYFNLGNSLFGQQRLSEAAQQYAKAIQLGCKDEVMQRLYYLVGTINQIQGKNDEALINYEKSDAIPCTNVDYAEMLLKKVQIYVEQNDLEKAETCALQLKLLVPSEFKSYQLLFQLYLEQSKLLEASRTLDEAVKYCGKDAEIETEIFFDKAMLCCFQAEQTKSIEQQKDYYNSAINILSEIIDAEYADESDKFEAIITKAELYLKLGQYEEAIKLAELTSQESRSELIEYVDRARYILVRSFSNKKQFSDVQRYARMLKESENLFYRHYGYYAEAYAEKQLSSLSPDGREKYLNLYNYAIAYYKNCTISVPGDFLAYLFRAKCYVDIGKFDKAEEIGKILPKDSQKALQEYINQERRG